MITKTDFSITVEQCIVNERGVRCSLPADAKVPSIATEDDYYDSADAPSPRIDRHRVTPCPPDEEMTPMLTTRNLNPSMMCQICGECQRCYHYHNLRDEVNKLRRMVRALSAACEEVVGSAWLQGEENQLPEIPWRVVRKCAAAVRKADTLVPPKRRSPARVPSVRSDGVAKANGGGASLDVSDT